MRTRWKISVEWPSQASVKISEESFDTKEAAEVARTFFETQGWGSKKEIFPVKTEVFEEIFTIQGWMSREKWNEVVRIHQKLLLQRVDDLVEKNPSLAPVRELIHQGHLEDIKKICGYYG